MHRSVVAISASFGRGITHCMVINFGVFAASFMETFKVQNKDVGFVLAISQCFSLAGGPVSYMILKRIGFKLAVLLAAFLIFVGLLGISILATNFLVLGIFLAVIGFSANIATTAGLLIVPQLFQSPSERQKFFAFYNVGSGLFMLIWHFILIELIEAYPWRQAVLILSAIVLNLIPVSMVYPKNFKIPVPEARHNPNISQQGQSHRSKHKISEEPLIQEITIVESQRIRVFSNEPQETSLSIWRNAGYVGIFVASYLTHAFGSVFFTFIFICLKDQELTGDETAISMMLLGGFSIVSRMFVAYSRNIITIPTDIQWFFVSMVNGIHYAIFAMFPTVRPVLHCNAIFCGLCFGAVWALHSVVVSDLLPEHQIAKGLSFSYFAFGLGAFTGPLLAGILIGIIHKPHDHNNENIEEPKQKPTTLFLSYFT